MYYIFDFDFLTLHFIYIYIYIYIYMLANLRSDNKLSKMFQIKSYQSFSAPLTYQKIPS